MRGWTIHLRLTMPLLWHIQPAIFQQYTGVTQFVYVTSQQLQSLFECPGPTALLLPLDESIGIHTHTSAHLGSIRPAWASQVQECSPLQSLNHYLTPLKKRLGFWNLSNPVIIREIGAFFGWVKIICLFYLFFLIILLFCVFLKICHSSAAEFGECALPANVSRV